MLIVAPERDTPGTMASGLREADQQRVAGRDVNAAAAPAGPVAARRSARKSTAPITAMVTPTSAGRPEGGLRPLVEQQAGDRPGDGGQRRASQSRRPSGSAKGRPRRMPRRPAEPSRHQSPAKA